MLSRQSGPRQAGWWEERSVHRRWQQGRLLCFESKKVDGLNQHWSFSQRLKPSSSQLWLGRGVNKNESKLGIVQHARPFEPCPCNHLHSLPMACSAVQRGAGAVMNRDKDDENCSALHLQYFLTANQSTRKKYFSFVLH